MGPYTAVVDFVPLGPATKQDIHQLLHYNNVVATNQEDQHILLEVDLAANWHNQNISLQIMPGLSSPGFIGILLI